MIFFKGDKSVVRFLSIRNVIINNSNKKYECTIDQELANVAE